jgi:hypothetical protein
LCSVAYKYILKEVDNYRATLDIDKLPTLTI